MRNWLLADACDSSNLSHSYKFALFIKACNCHILGSLNDICNEKGKCTCKPFFTGEKCQKCLDNYAGKNCDRCADTFYGYPDCKGR